MKKLTVITAPSEFTDRFILELINKEYVPISVCYDYDEFIMHLKQNNPDVIVVLLDKKSSFIEKAVKYISSETFKIPYIFCVKNVKNKIVVNISKYRPHNIIYEPFIAEQLINMINLTLENQSKMTPQTINLSTINDGRTSANSSSTGSNPNSRNYAFFKSGTEIIKVYFSDIHYVQSDHVYVFLNSGVKKIPLRAKLEDVENYLPANQFQRIHQRYIVNIDHITKVIAESVFLDKVELPLAKKYKKVLLARMSIF